MTLEDYNKLKQSFHDDFDKFRKSAFIKILVWCFCIIGFVISSLIMSSWTIALIGLLVSILIYFLLGLSRAFNQIEEINNKVKGEIAFPFISLILPQCTFKESGRHNFEDIKSTKIFKSWLKESKIKGKGYYEYISEDIILKISELDINQLKLSLLLQLT